VDIKSEPRAAERVDSNPEMVITSNLTTLNLDGDNSSSDGAFGVAVKPIPQNSLDEDEIQQLKDKKYLDQFRKRQNRLTHNEPDDSLEIN